MTTGKALPSGATNTEVTAQLSAFLAQAQLSDLPVDVVQRCIHLALDGLACAIVGAHLPGSKIAVEAVAKLEGTGSASIVGWRENVPPSAAALLNSTFIRGVELDDHPESTPLRSVSVVLPAALATVEALDREVTGAEFLLAIALGLEVGSRIDRAMRKGDPLGSEGHSPAAYGGVAAASAAAKLRRLSAQEFEQALRVAASQAPGLMSFQFGSMLTSMNHGFGSRNGVLAAALAEYGFSGSNEAASEHDHSGGGVLGNDSGADATRVIAEIGDRWELLDILVTPHVGDTRTKTLTNAEIRSKFRSLVPEVVGERRAAELEATILMMAEFASAKELIDLLTVAETKKVRLRRKVRQLEAENEILRAAAAQAAKDTP